MLWKNKMRGMIILCAVIVLGAGCSRNAAERKASEQEASSTEELADALFVDVEVVSLNQVNFSWSRVRDADRYVIDRQELDHDDDTIPGMEVGSRKQIAVLSAQETSYQDTTAKAGNYYQYNIHAYSDDNGQDSEDDEQDAVEINEADSEEGENGFCFLTEEVIVQMAVEGVYWETDREENIDASPSAITVMTCFNINRSNMVVPTGLEIYRGEHPDTMKKLADVAISREDTDQGEQGIRYVDENVEEGKSYYYQTRAYADLDGERQYGFSSNYLHRSAIFPQGDYSMEFTQAKGKSFSAEVSLKSNGKGNGELQFIGNQLHGMVDFIYQKKDHSYASIPLSVTEYRQGNGAWTSFQDQPLSLKGKETISLRIAPWDDAEAFPPLKESWRSAEMILTVKYDGRRRSLHFDLQKDQAFLTEADSDQDAPLPNADIVNEFDLNRKGKTGKGSVPDAEIAYLESNYAEMYISARNTGKKQNCPDGVEIYRSRDDQNYSLAGTAQYPEYGSACFSDPAVSVEDTFYYKARNYMDTDAGRIYGDYSESVKPQLPAYHGGRYKLWSVTDEMEKEQGQIVVGFYSYSRINPVLALDYAYCEWEGEELPLAMKEYSRDGIHWKKFGKSRRDFRLSAREMVYLKMEPTEQQEKFRWEEADLISLSAALAVDSCRYIDFYYDIAEDSTHYTLSRDD